MGKEKIDRTDPKIERETKAVRPNKFNLKKAPVWPKKK